MPQTLKRGTVYMVASLGISMTASFGTQVVAGRMLGPELYGLYGLVIANENLVSGLLSPGLSSAMATFASEKDTHKDSHGIKELIKDGLRIEFFLALLLAFISLSLLRPIADSFFAHSRELVIVFLIIAILDGLYGLLAGVLQGFRELKSVAIIRGAERGILFGLTLGLLGGMSVGLRGALIALIISMGVALIWTALAVWRFAKDRIKQYAEAQLPEEIKGGQASYYREILMFAGPVSLAAVTTAFIQSSGPAITNYFSGSAQQLGFLVAILTLARTANRLLTTIFRSAYPYLVRWNTKGSIDKLRRYIVLMIVLISGSYLLLFIGVQLFGTEIVRLLYGEDYVPMVNYLPLALFAYCAISIQDLIRIAIFSIKLPGRFLIINALGLIIFVIILLTGVYALHYFDLINLLFFSMAIAHIVIAAGAILFLRRYLSLKGLAATEGTLQTVEG